MFPCHSHEIFQTIKKLFRILFPVLHLHKEAADKAAAAVAAEAIARYYMKFSKELLGGGKTCSDALNAAKIEAFGKADDAADYGSDWKVTYVSNKVTAMNEANKGTYAIDFEEPFCN